MTDLDTIIRGMQFEAIYGKNPINTTGQPREVITFEFAGSSKPSDFTQDYTGWTAFTAAERAGVIANLEHIETFLNVDFQQVFNAADPDLNIGKVSLAGNTAGTGGFSFRSFRDDITELDSFAVFDNGLDISNRTSLVLHELGHALGLKHPFSDPVVPAGTDSNKYTLMSYSVNPDNRMDSDAMMLFDILALQDVWGAAAYNTGDTAYTGKRTDTVDAVWDTGGLDKFSAAGYSTAVILDLNEGAFSRFGTYDDVVITYGTVIENATGGNGNDTLRGNAISNKLAGNSGNDTLSGFDGKDKLTGNAGDDTLLGGAKRDKLFGGKGDDTLNGQDGSDVLAGNLGADRFVFEVGGDRDKIVDFTDDVDTLDLRDFGFASVDQALGFAKQWKQAVVFEFDDGDRLKLNGATLGELTDDILV